MWEGQGRRRGRALRVLGGPTFGLLLSILLCVPLPTRTNPCSHADTPLPSLPPQTQATFYACPATGQTTWDPPENTFLLPPSSEGEWWELRDDSRGGISYFYHTRSGETVWERPDGFVIPLGMIQVRCLPFRSVTALGRVAVVCRLRSAGLTGAV
ncbi:hypothetical protein CALCODRAFT_310769 [Calocera cornea HHB12733]|uniref:WW domain-containing protein n=1 Tax=Calocera cornea HHB12733 TaxID=1353952 RepID=A0A165FF27_9BASI|nr:hypothetical protein CALCODRAFT_310769 [Calocera cornea HHB12733]